VKIACITTSQMPTSSAHSIQAVKVCQALAQLGHTVKLWIPGSHQTPSEQSQCFNQEWDTFSNHYGLSTPFEVEWVPCSSSLRRYDFAWKSVRRAHAWGADLVYTWTPQAAVLALMLGAPTIIELHDMPSGRFGPWLFRLFLKHNGKKRLLVTTDGLRRKLEAAYHVSLQSPETQIAPNGTELERYNDLPDTPTARKNLDLPERPTVVYSGHFYAGRGMDLLLELAHAFPQVTFLWIGGRPNDLAPWKEQLEQSKLHNVVMTGFIENSRLPLYQAAADVLLMPYSSKVSGSSGGNIVDVFNPMKMFDYLATGRAILSSDLPVLHEVLNTGNTVFCPPDDLPAWQTALSALLADPTRGQRLGAQAHLDARLYTWRRREENALEGFA